MERIRSGIQALREHRKGGLALIVALCASALLLSLTLSLIHAAALPMARADRKILQERVRQQANSFAEQTEQALAQYNTDEDLDNVGEMVIKAPTDSFHAFADKFLEGGFQEYDPEHPLETTYTYTAASEDEDYGDVTIRLRKSDQAELFLDAIQKVDPTEPNSVRYNSYGAFNYENRSDPDQGVPAAEGEEFRRYRLTVDVSVVRGDDAANRTTEYYRKDCYRPFYTWHVIDCPDWLDPSVLTTDVPVYWDWGTGKFYRDTDLTSEMGPHEYVYTVEDEATGENIEKDRWTEEVEISYVYVDKGELHPTFKRYVTVYEEENGDADDP